MSKKETKAKATKQAEKEAEPVVKPDENGQLSIDVAPEMVQAQIKVNIGKLLKKRDEAREKFKGGLKRTTFEAIEEKGLTDEHALWEEHLKIEKKESKLSSAERTLIQQIALISMQEVFEAKIKEAREAGEIAAPIQKHKRTKKAK